MRGIDALIFTGDIGENATLLRSRIVGAVAWVRLGLDATANTASERRIDTSESAVQLRVMRTAVIARHAFQGGAVPTTR